MTGDAAAQAGHDTRTARDWLEAYVSTYYFAPSLAFWRALEAQALGSEPILEPSLDVGAFDGSFAAPWLGHRPPMDVGLDIKPVPSPTSDRAYRHMVRGDGQRLPFADGTFNFVLCNSVIEHVPDDTLVLREMARVLRRDGVLLLSTPSTYFHDSLEGVRRARRQGDEAAARAYMKHVDERVFHLRYRSLEEWTRMLTDAGLGLESHAYCVPPDAGAAWDRWDEWGTRRILGRDLHGYIHSRKLARIVPTTLWKAIFMRALAADYARAVEEQNQPGALGISLVLRAVRL